MTQFLIFGRFLTVNWKLSLNSPQIVFVITDRELNACVLLFDTNYMFIKCSCLISALRDGKNHYLLGYVEEIPFLTNILFLKRSVDLWEIFTGYFLFCTSRLYLVWDVCLCIDVCELFSSTRMTFLSNRNSLLFWWFGTHIFTVLSDKYVVGNSP